MYPRRDYMTFYGSIYYALVLPKLNISLTILEDSEPPISISWPQDLPYN
jgi:hypothetical protein